MKFFRTKEGGMEGWRDRSLLPIDLDRFEGRVAPIQDKYKV